MSEATRLLAAAAAGDPGAAADLLPVVYDELRKLAAARLAAEPAGQTLQPTALVHEAYLRLAGDPTDGRWDGRSHFFAAAAEAMRRILVEAARRKATAKRGGGRRRVEVEPSSLAADDRADDLLALDQALTDLERHDPVAARLVNLRYFAGMSHQEAAAALGLGRRAADRLWALARAWLYQHMSGE